MTVYELRDNLKNTIKGKELLLDSYDTRSGIAAQTAKSFLEINIDELKKILVDVEICCERERERSWIGVDRQGGC